MDATSQAARIIAELCGCTPEEAASLKEGYKVHWDTSGTHHFIQYPEEKGCTSLFFRSHVGNRKCGEVLIRLDGHTRITSRAYTHAGAITVADQVEALKYYTQRKNAPAYLCVLYALFASANERLAATADA